MSRPRIDIATTHAAFLQEFLLQRRAIDVPAVEGLYSESPDESVHLDYKGGDFATPAPGSQKKFTNELAKWLAGFANSVGGVLVVGVSERKTGAHVVGHDLAPIRGLSRDQVEGAVTQAFGKLHPNLPRRHRFVILDHDGGLILIAGVDRADHLVPIVESADLAYYLRVGTSTLRAPPYLAQDLLLGRRQRTSLRLEVLRPEYQKFDPSFEGRDDRGSVKRLSFVVRLTNVGLVWLEQPRIGLVTHSVEDVGERAPRELVAANIRIRATGRAGDEPRLVRLDLRPTRRLAVDEGRPRVITGAPLPIVDTLGPVEVAYAGARAGSAIFVAPQAAGWHAAALYVVSRGQPPVWYQLLFSMHPRYEDGIRCWLGTCDGDAPFVGSAPDFPTELGEHLHDPRQHWTVRFAHADTVEQGLEREDRL